MKQKGFSLIELLVVMAIIGIVLSVVAPNIFQFKLRFEIQKEQKDLATFVSRQSYNSYFHEKAQTISFIGNKISGSLGAEQHFQYLTFAEGEFNIDRLGALSAEELTYLANGNPVVLELKSK